MGRTYAFVKPTTDVINPHDHKLLLHTTDPTSTPPSDLPRQHAQPLGMMRLREQVDRPETVDLVPLLPPLVAIPDQLPDVPRHGMHVATDIDDPFRVEPDDLAEETLVAPLPRRVDDQRRLVPRPGEGLGDRVEQRLGSAGVERGVGDVVHFGIVAGVGDRVGIDLDSTDLGAAGRETSNDQLGSRSRVFVWGDSQMLGQRQAEQTTPTIRIDQVGFLLLLGTLVDLIPRKRGQRTQDRGVVLEKGSGGELHANPGVSFSRLCVWPAGVAHLKDDIAHPLGYGMAVNRNTDMLLGRLELDIRAQTQVDILSLRSFRRDNVDRRRLHPVVHPFLLFHHPGFRVHYGRSILLDPTRPGRGLDDERIPEQQRRSPLVRPDVLLDRRSSRGHGVHDRLACDRTDLDIQDPRFTFPLEADRGIELDRLALSFVPGRFLCCECGIILLGSVQRLSALFTRLESLGQLEMRGDLGPVVVLLRTGDRLLDLGDLLGGKIGKVVHGFDEDVTFECQLLFVGQELVLAPRTGSKVFTTHERVVPGRLDGESRCGRVGRDDLERVGKRVVVLVSGHLGLDHIAGQGERNDDGPLRFLRCYRVDSDPITVRGQSDHRELGFGESPVLRCLLDLALLGYRVRGLFPSKALPSRSRPWPYPLSQRLSFRRGVARLGQLAPPQGRQEIMQQDLVDRRCPSGLLVLCIPLAGLFPILDLFGWR